MPSITAPTDCFPSSGLILDDEGNLYGTTWGNTLYKIDNTGKFSVPYTFRASQDGSEPIGGLLRDAEGNIYGTTAGGGKSSCNFGTGCGTVFKIDAAGTETVLYSFLGGADGAYPQANVIRDSAGNLYGTTTNGGNPGCRWGCGTVFKLDASGAETVLHTFTGGADGSNPTAGLTLDAAGNLYGVTAYGGYLACPAGLGHGCGTVFKIAPNGTKTVLYAFTGGKDGAYPGGNLILDAAGNLYGTTGSGGDANNDGTIFKIDSTGAETILHRFNNSGGSGPSAGVIRDSAGNLYGTTEYGGKVGSGTVFKLAP